ncbi:phytanoyl-CoA dioxygenase PhyH [Litoreibacter ponti]|uniref:Phytanoyl-CoA dioxygenase PhyH n=1 Tax=Litoreibacter ponti TaxID=1510457 RepID=A0A2T6BL06_9RHOB|nr:phytanoyl-CoA dioxygenase family protein [Litoreibacter ponti]PTX56727.1 phytanoyl-CoA dioxygenase PhyH [Litoreibacter ponti]
MLDSLTLAEGHLTEDQIAQYWRDGFLFPLPCMTPAEAHEMRAELEQIERDWLDAGLPLPLNTYKRINAHIVLPLAHRIATHPGVLDVVEGVLGPDILVFAAEFFIKEARTTQIVTMHQDLTYWGLGAIDGLVTAWVPLSPATPASGCMDFVRGSHKNAILPHADSFDANNLLSRGQEVQVDVAPEDRVAIEIYPGQMSLHHGLTIHGSGPNTSDDRRIAAVIRYMRPDVVPSEGCDAMRARGSDTSGRARVLTPPRSNFEAGALARYEAIRQAQAKVMMKGAKGSSGIYA